MHIAKSKNAEKHFKNMRKIFNKALHFENMVLIQSSNQTGENIMKKVYEMISSDGTCLHLRVCDLQQLRFPKQQYNKSTLIEVVAYDLTNEQYTFSVDKNQPGKLLRPGQRHNQRDEERRNILRYLRQVLRRRHSRSYRSPQLSVENKGISSSLRPTPLSSPLST